MSNKEKVIDIEKDILNKKIVESESNEVETE